MINALRGMKDLLPSSSQTFDYIIHTATHIAKRHGFEWISTPILEETTLFKRSVGESSDIVGKEMYQFIDKGENDVCMRPEGTAGVVRAFIENKLDRQGGVHRFFYTGPMFRYERPQKGRLRQFHQFGCEVFGEANWREDVAVIAMAAEIFTALGIEFTLKINSLGCPTCSPSYRTTLVTFLEPLEANLCEDCKRRMRTNPLRTLDCKNAHCQSLLTEAPKMKDNLCPSCESDFIHVQVMLNALNIPFVVDTTLVRGLDYYSKTAFEFVSTAIGAQSAIAGGGRYDRLVEFLGGKPTPAFGFAIGIERIMELVSLPVVPRLGVYLGAMRESGVEILTLIGLQMKSRIPTTLSYEAKSLKSHLKGADKANALWIAFMGEDEEKNGTIWLKNLETKEEKTVSLSVLGEAI